MASADSAGALPSRVIAEDPRFSAFLRVSFDVLYDWNVKTGEIFFTEQIDEMLGVPEGHSPHTLDEWLDRIHPDDRDSTLETLQETVSRGQPLRAEYRFRAADGHYLLVSDQGIACTDCDGYVSNVIGAMRDITYEQESRAMKRLATDLQRILSSIANPMWRVDSRGCFLDANDGALEFLQQSREDVIGRSMKDDFPSVWCCICDEGRVVDTMQVEVSCIVGERTKNLLVTVIVSHAVDELSYFLLGTEITDLKELQQELARSQDALRSQAMSLAESNTALRVILRQREQDQAELGERIQASMDLLVEPTLNRLSHLLHHRPEQMELETLRHTLRALVDPFARRLTTNTPPAGVLTRREIQVANLVHLGRTTCEIAEELHLSQSAVSFHRANIRRKYGLTGKAIRLATHLSSLARS